jgi:NUMOD1 domain
MWKIYKLHTSTDETAKYIGITKGTLSRRKRQHVYDLRSALNGQMSSKTKWMLEVLSNSEEIVITQLFTFNDINDAQLKEVELINSLPDLTNSKMYKTHITEWTEEDKSKFQTNAIKVYQFSKDGIFIKEWVGAKEIERYTGYCHSAISRCCKGIYRSYKGFFWSYSLNINHLLKPFSHHNCKMVIVENIYNIITHSFNSVGEAAAFCKVSNSTIKSAAKGTIKIVNKQFKIKYYEPEK